MSLDSVELVMEVEKRFAMRFEDARMASIHTVRQLADEACRHLMVEAESFGERDPIAFIVQAHLSGHDEGSRLPAPFPSEVARMLRQALAEHGCGLPELGPFGPLRIFSILQDSGGSLERPTIGQFIDRIVAHNHGVLVPPGTPLSRYGVAMAVLGIVAESSGVPILRIDLDDSLTMDLGID